MKTAISNIAWTAEDDDRVLAFLGESAIDAIEIAPTRLLAAPFEASAAEIAAVRTRWHADGKPIVAAQALLYGRPDLLLFESDELREATLAHLDSVMAFCAAVGAGPLVFGSPKNRRRGALAAGRAFDIARAFFGEAGRLAERHGVVLVLEPNPERYGCDFVTRGQEGIELVRAVDHPGFRLHLDAAGMTLAGDDLGAVIEDAGDLLAHFHASEPDLGPIGEGGVDHPACAEALRRIGYIGHVSVEMRHAPDRDALEEIGRAVAFVTEVYGDATS